LTGFEGANIQDRVRPSDLLLERTMQVAAATNKMPKLTKQMKKRLDGLAEMFGQDRVVRIARTRIDEFDILGFVVGLSDDLLLLQVIDGNTLFFSGYSVIRLRDITSWRFDNTFVDRSLRLLDRIPVVPDAIQLADWPSLISSAKRRSPLIMIEMEKKVPGKLWVGRVARQTKRSVAMIDVDPDGHWAPRQTKSPYSDITRVQFGDAYSEALAMLVEHEAKEAANTTE
jgi:hypothetical protein